MVDLEPSIVQFCGRCRVSKLTSERGGSESTVRPKRRLTRELGTQRCLLEKGKMTVKSKLRFVNVIGWKLIEFRKHGVQP